ncbi:hypothetical protein [Phaeobacter sp.]|uniref:hypothetical protein n=1 Tax=Phaeobacter sp. TaxID=1902409 RepID=UPI0025F7210E|nr:hypothetical protein [Phaeobacter sp.]
MDLGFDPAAMAASAEGASSNLMLIGAIAFFGFFGRLLFVAFGPGLAKANPLANFSGLGLIAVAVALIFGGLFVTGNTVKAQILVQRHLVDPVVVSVLGKDSCDIGSSAYCVLVFENGREMSVNWHDKRVHLYDVLTPTVLPLWQSLRPRGRPDRGAPTVAVTHIDAS